MKNSKLSIEEQSEMFVKLTKEFPWLSDRIIEDTEFARYFFRILEGENPVVVILDIIYIKRELVKKTSDTYKLLSKVYESEIEKLNEEIKQLRIQNENLKDGL